MWLRRLRNAFVRRRVDRTAATLEREVRAPDPYVWPLLSPYDARWRRWHKRCRAAGRYLPWPSDEPCWATTDHPQPSPWQTDDDMVRPYVLKP